MQKAGCSLLTNDYNLRLITAAIACKNGSFNTTSVYCQVSCRFNDSSIFLQRVESRFYLLKDLCFERSQRWQVIHIGKMSISTDVTNQLSGVDAF